MFGYITINPAALSKEDNERFRQVYCGLCHTLSSRCGQSGRLVLSYDMTFLCMLLNSLYEPDEHKFAARCPARPWRKMSLSTGEAEAYCADMNIAFAYFKAMDDMHDDNSLKGRAMVSALKSRYERVRKLYPQKCEIIESEIANLSRYEKEKTEFPDPPANTMGNLFGEVYAWKNDFWRDTLYALGSSIGRFIYLTDAYDDLKEDIKKGHYNPLTAYAKRPDYEDFIKRVLMMIISEGAQAFEMLPLMQDTAILRNVLYSGVWSRYSAIQKEKETKEKPRKENKQ